ncbi:uncharacterized protein FOBCDRAFT_204149 [Fusarium oxysporum Fo47]|uniref:uncharacterized protein n=1 Tax=Fusarium oxysporum Fo47 TaxID=660027 RepID=UPI002869C47E|nr:uncharacterized protein FOBCDRAFT_204149 [Fusarium oxysporum Fo47]QKD57152.2 hypothetical protein FOBCDRAFT_204149 [Fusarium oxysporum Fo47]
MSSAQLEYLNQDVWKDGIFGSLLHRRFWVHLQRPSPCSGPPRRQRVYHRAQCRKDAQDGSKYRDDPSGCRGDGIAPVDVRDFKDLQAATGAVRQRSRRHRLCNSQLPSAAKDYSIFEVNLIDTKPVPQSQNQSSPTTESLTLQISVDGSKVVAHCVTPSPDPGSLDHAQTIYCHFSHLGTWKSCRAAVEVKSDAQKDMVAPMPCKVLSVQKDRGDKVEVGDVVMVVESMKMEVSLKASGAGQFQTQWKAGDAVNEGQVLYQVV